jgi:capsular exopolysaccharide synthesis family protein
MVASGVSGEGKTTLSSHLAQSLAQAGRRTLLIDCDLLHPIAHELFDLPLQPGLCEVLRGEFDLSTALVPTTVPDLTLLSAGRYDRQISQILANGWMEQLLANLRREYEFIILDTCPVLSVANTLLIGQHVDGVILSILRDMSQTPRVSATYQRLATLGIRVIGAVFNKARSDVYGYYGYYGHKDHAAKG